MFPSKIVGFLEKMRSQWSDARRRSARRKSRRGNTLARRSPNRSRFVAMVEILESRQVLSGMSIMVDTAADTSQPGQTTLRDAITQANQDSGDTITFASSLAGQTITLTQGELLVTSSMTVTGLGASQLTISGGGNSRIFDICANDGGASHVSITGLTLTDGNGTGANYMGAGGAIYNSENLTLAGNTFSGNSATSGGGLENRGTLKSSSNTFSANIASYTVSGGGGGGGGIDNNGSLTSSNDTFSGNTAEEGGGIENFRTMTSTSDTFSANIATVSGGGGEGGGIDNNGSLTSSNDTFSGNTAEVGGGIENYGTMTSTSDTFSANIAVSGGGGDGGGIHNYGSLTSSNDTFSGNTAAVGGGIENYGTMTSTSDTFSANFANYTVSGGGGEGGGINNYGSLTSSNDTFSGNTAAEGGGIENFGTMTSTSDTFSANIAKYIVNGGGGWGGGGGGGGGIDNYGSLTSSNDTFSGNTAADGGGIENFGTMASTSDTFSANFANYFVTDGRGYGGGGGGGIFNYGTLTSSDDTFSGNTAAEGGGINNGGTMASTNDTISGNFAKYTVIGGANFEGNGGGIFNHGVIHPGTVSLVNTIVLGNYAGAPIVNYASEFSTDILNDDGGNLISDSTSLASVLQTTTDPTTQLVVPVLANNGGPTQTIALVNNSTNPALGTGVALTTLFAPIPDTTTTAATVTDVTFLAVGDLLKIDNEIVQVTAINNDTLTLLRGQGGTIAASHSSGASLTLAYDQRGIARGNPSDIGAFELQPLTVGPQTIVVDTASDVDQPGQTTLRDAITQANKDDGDTITFAPSLAGQTITLSQGELLITSSMTITGLGSSQLTIDGNNSSRIFDIDANDNFASQVTISGLTLTGGNGVGANLNGGGGAIFNNESLTLANNVFTQNKTGPNEGGGAIVNFGILTSSNDVFSDNQSADGGAIYICGMADANTFSFVNDTFSGNIADYNGGAIFVGGLGTLTLSDSTVSGNNAGWGGGGIYNDFAIVVSTSDSFLNNSVSSGEGGGIFSCGPFTSTNDTIAGNSASYGTVSNYSNQSNTGDGGGVYIDQTTFIATNDTISGNTASAGAAESNIIDITKAHLPTDGFSASNFGSTGEGGGIYNFMGTVTAVHTTVSGNTADFEGGGVYNYSLIAAAANDDSTNCGPLVRPGYASTMNLLNTIVLGNDVQGTVSNIATDGGVVNDAGGNLISNATPVADVLVTTADSTTQKIVPLLANNGGPTQTIALIDNATNPALGTGVAIAMLSADISDPTYATAVVADATFLAVGDSLQIDSEIVTVTAIDGNTLTLVRGQAGTIAAVHTSGADITLAYDQRGGARSSPSDIGAYELHGQTGAQPVPADPGNGDNKVLSLSVHPWCNAQLPEDVLGTGIVAPIDALQIINELHAHKYTDTHGKLPASPPPNGQTVFLDVDADNYVAPIDALLIINYLNSAKLQQAKATTPNIIHAAIVAAPSDVGNELPFVSPASNVLTTFSNQVAATPNLPAVVPAAKRTATTSFPLLTPVSPDAAGSLYSENPQWGGSSDLENVLDTISPEIASHKL